MELSGSILFLHDIPHTRLGMMQIKSGNRKILGFENNPTLCNFYYDLIIDVHIQDTSIGIDVLFEFCRTVNGQWLVAIDLAGEHQDSW